METKTIFLSDFVNRTQRHKNVKQPSSSVAVSIYRYGSSSGIY